MSQNLAEALLPGRRAGDEVLGEPVVGAGPPAGGDVRPEARLAEQGDAGFRHPLVAGTYPPRPPLPKREGGSKKGAHLRGRGRSRRRTSGSPFPFREGGGG